MATGGMVIEQMIAGKRSSGSNRKSPTCSPIASCSFSATSSRASVKPFSGSPGACRLRTLHEIMDEVYGLFDRRCRMPTALAKLARLRQQVQRMPQVRQALQSLFSTNLEKALTFLDDGLLPATSNAIESANRRYRKMQKTVYRVRTYPDIVGRIALELPRDAFAQARTVTLQLLHQARASLDFVLIRLVGAKCQNLER